MWARACVCFCLLWDQTADGCGESKPGLDSRPRRPLAPSPPPPQYLLTFSFPLNNSRLMSLPSLPYAALAAPFHSSFCLNLFPTLHAACSPSSTVCPPLAPHLNRKTLLQKAILTKLVQHYLHFPTMLRLSDSASFPMRHLILPQWVLWISVQMSPQGFWSNSPKW